MFERIKARIIFSVIAQPRKYNILKISTQSTNECDFAYKVLKLEYESNELQGYLFECRNKLSETIVFLCHGYGSSAKDMLPYAKHFLEKGYEVFIPDLRGHGRSKGRYSGLGVNDVKDIDAWMRLIDPENSKAKIILGASMGGTIALRTAAQLSSNRRIKGIIVDSVPIDFWKIAERVYSWKMKGSLKQIKTYINSIMRRTVHFELEDLNLMPMLHTIDIPVLFIHGKDDGLVDFNDTQKGYDKISAPKRFLLVEKSDHLGALHVLGNEYWKCIDSFIALIESDAEQPA